MTMLLVPPYDAWVEDASMPAPPLGTIAFEFPHRSTRDGVQSEHPSHRHPWVPRLGPHGGSSPLHVKWDAVPTPADALNTVNHRPPPTTAQIGRWLGDRLADLDVEYLVRRAVDATTSVPLAVSNRTFYRLLTRQLHCHPGDLKRLVFLASFPRLYPTVDRLAAAGTTTTRLRERLHRGLGVTLRDYNQMPGWEWVLEAALRQGLGKDKRREPASLQVTPRDPSQPPRHPDDRGEKRSQGSPASIVGDGPALRSLAWRSG